MNKPIHTKPIAGSPSPITSKIIRGRHAKNTITKLIRRKVLNLIINQIFFLML